MPAKFINRSRTNDEARNYYRIAKRAGAPVHLARRMRYWNPTRFFSRLKYIYPDAFRQD